MSEYTRRRFVSTLAAGAATATLAGCTGDRSSSGDDQAMTAESMDDGDSMGTDSVDDGESMADGGSMVNETTDGGESMTGGETTDSTTEGSMDDRGSIAGEETNETMGDGSTTAETENRIGEATVAADASP